jgi:hypothetical protein
MFLIIFQKLLLDALLDFFYFPIWWYTEGVVYIGKKCYRIFLQGNEELAPAIWLKNLFVPMFGTRDWEGKIVSFFMRLVQIIGRSAALLVWLVFCWILFFCWLLFPLLVVYGIIINLIRL